MQLIHSFYIRNPHRAGKGVKILISVAMTQSNHTAFFKSHSLISDMTFCFTVVEGVGLMSPINTT
jgi:hypothetical protein